MLRRNTSHSTPSVVYGTTEQFASSQLVRAQSVRKRLCLTGSYFGVVPEKLPSGRLRWPLGG
ncbi:MAG: monooxygenase [Betaproteobacteria bacterium HGW-Betaproteobacteria-12]|nr:MAG: monooxygenase [Betaproteobacteria bacterium HGW-Betaproteobacteria-12]